MEGRKQFPELDDLFLIKPDALSSDFCKHLIAKFEIDRESQEIGITGNGYQPEHKKTTDIWLMTNDKWQDELHELFGIINGCVLEYLENLGDIIRFRFPELDYDSIIMARYPADGGHFGWHFDGDSPAHPNRIIQCIIYLNDVSVGGETVYPVFGKTIKPEEGKVIIAPTSFPFIHKSNACDGLVKYAIIAQIEMRNT